jgi:F0F1-type ATP synthase delta subunit
MAGKAGELFRHQVSPVVLIRLHARRNLAAGLRVRTGKHVYDLSLATRLQAATGNMQEILYAN